MTSLSETKAKWTDGEKLALLISVIKDTNPNPNWANLVLPQGRTLRASQTTFGQLKKDAAAHPTTDVAANPAGKKRGRKSVNGNEGDTAATPKKRVRKPKNADRAAAPIPNEDDEEEMPSKKVKVEVENEEEEDGMNAEIEGQGEI